MSVTNLSLAENALQARIRDKLNAEAVKLWIEPFYDEATLAVNDGEILALASRYATELQFSEAEVSTTLFNLQRNAIERLAERDHYKSTGLATVRVKVSGFSTDSVKAGNIEKLEVNLAQMTGADLKSRIAEQIGVNVNRLKLICLGRVVKEEFILEQQNIKNGTQVMVLAVAGDQEALQKSEDQFRQMEETRGAAEYLAEKDLGGMYSLQVADQSGKPLELPPAEKKALAIALALHEKGRSSLKVSEFSKALVFFLEADTVYSRCQSNILEMVDNYGILNLDIAWCYLSLQSIAELPAVESRLSKCEKSLHRSYGENMERVLLLKGSTGWEAALFVRLHLLQGIAAYHLGQIEKSKFYFVKVEGEMSRLRVSDDQLADLINMGYGAEEARMALRATYGNVTASVDWIIRQRDEKAEVRKQEKEDLARRKLQKRLGVTENGQPVNVSVYRSMQTMGYKPAFITAALKRANNEINAAIQLVSDQTFIDGVIQDLKARHAASVAAAAAAAPPAGTDAPGPSTAIGAAGAIAGLSASLQGLLDGGALEEPEEVLSNEELERSQKAYDALAKDVCSESEYIDLNLSAETEYLDQYKVLLHI